MSEWYTRRGRLARAIAGKASGLTFDSQRHGRPIPTLTEPVEASPPVQTDVDWAERGGRIVGVLAGKISGRAFSVFRGSTPYIGLTEGGEPAPPPTEFSKSVTDLAILSVTEGRTLGISTPAPASSAYGSAVYGTSVYGGTGDVAKTAIDSATLGALEIATLHVPAQVKTVNDSAVLSGLDAGNRLLPPANFSVTDTSTLVSTEAVQAVPLVVTDPEPTVDDGAAYTIVVGGAYGISSGVSDSEIAIAASQAGLGGSSLADSEDIPAGLGGGVTIDTRYYRANRQNEHLEDISQYFEGGQLTVDLANVSPMTVQIQSLDETGLTPFQDWIAPVMTVRYPDPTGEANITVRRQLGLYCVMPPQTTFSAAGGVETVDGRDALWLLASARISKAYSVAAGTNVGAAIETICDDADLRHAIQTTSETMPRKRTWRTGTSKLQIANDLARSIGFVPLWTDRVGRVRSQRFKRLGNVEPARTISSSLGHVLDTIPRKPDLARLCNHVVAVGNDPKGTPIRATRINNDPSSPTSTVSLGTRSNPVVITKYVEDPNIDKQAALDDLADRLMDQGSSVYVQLTVNTVPFIDFSVGDVNLLDIETDSGAEVAAGRWRWERMTLGLGVDATQQWVCNKLISWSQVE